ncbi:MAG: hypothetical protein EOP83_31395 [Verrucomicrobiaceae bacterium]|nr:MAG: hypothetical protein EOP83_31395 [Verrucomicrobiaceae bacterium]
MNPDFAQDFPRQLRFWALHVPLNALPSFIIAISLFRFDKQPFAMVTMLSAIVIFILGLSTIVAVIPDLNRDGHPLKRGLRAVMTFRAWISGLSSAMLVIAPPSMSLTPDFWCGYISAGLVEELSKLLHLSSAEVSTGSFLPVMLTTALEGLIIAISIAMMSFFLCLYFQSRDRRKAFTSAGSPAPLRRSS